LLSSRSPLSLKCLCIYNAQPQHFLQLALCIHELGLGAFPWPESNLCHSCHVVISRGDEDYRFHPGILRPEVTDALDEDGGAHREDQSGRAKTRSTVAR